MFTNYDGYDAYDHDCSPCSGTGFVQTWRQFREIAELINFNLQSHTLRLPSKAIDGT